MKSVVSMGGDRSSSSGEEAETSIGEPSLIGGQAPKNEDAIEILEYVLKLREEKLGIANPDFDDEKKRLAELLKEARRSRNKKAKSLENLIDPNSRRTKKEASKKWSTFVCRS